MIGIIILSSFVLASPFILIGMVVLCCQPRVRLFFIKLCAKAGNPKAQCLLGKMYSQTYVYNIPKNDSEAVKWYTLSANQGNASAQNKLGLFYYYGWGVKEDLKKAKKWFKLSSEQGNKNSLHWFKHINQLGV